MFIKTFINQVKLPLFTVFVLVFATGGKLFPQQSVYVNIPQAAGLQVKLTGYDGFKTDTLAGTVLDLNGKGTIKPVYYGFMLLTVSGGKQYPVILKKQDVNFTLLNFDSLPAFPGDRENSLLYKYFVEKKNLSGNTMLLKDAFSFFMENDPYYPLLTEEKEALEKKEKQLEKIFADSLTYLGAVLLQAKSLMETTYGITTEEQLKDRKKAFIRFIKAHFNELRHSDIIQQMASQYVMMNEYVLVGQDNHYNRVVADIGDWISAFGKKLPAKDIVNFYIKISLGRSMVGLTSKIAEKYTEYSQCLMPEIKGETPGDTVPGMDVYLSSNSNYSIKFKSIVSETKLLYFMITDCPACYAQQVMLGRYMQEKGLKIPVITVLSDDKINLSMSLLTKLQKESFYFTVSESLYNTVGIEKCPAFVVLNKNNKMQKIYSLAELEKYFEGLKK